MVGRRHRQRAQRSADSRAHHAQRHRLRRRRRESSGTTRRRTARRSSTCPGGGASRATRRPDLIPGVDPFIKDGGRVFLNPAAFATPQPGTFGNLERNSIHGPELPARSTWSSRSGSNTGRGIERRVPRRDLQPLQPHQLRQPHRRRFPTRCPAPARATTQANRVQPGQPFTATVRRHLRDHEQHRRHDHRSRHEPAGAARLPVQLLVRRGRGIPSTDAIRAEHHARPGLSRAAHAARARFHDA